VHYPATVPASGAFGPWKEGSHPVAEDLCRRIVSLPLHPALTLREVDWTCQALAAILDDLGLIRT